MLRDEARETERKIPLSDTFGEMYCSFVEIDFGSVLAIVSVYMSENLGNLEETTKPVLVKDPCRKGDKNQSWNMIILICLGLLQKGY